MAGPFLNLANELKMKMDSVITLIDEGETTQIPILLRTIEQQVRGNRYIDSKYLQDIVIQGRLEVLESSVARGISSESKTEQKLQALHLEAQLVRCVLEQIESDYFKFNALQVLVVDSSTEVKAGDTYEACFYLAVMDTTMLPVILVADLSVPDSALVNGFEKSDARLHQVEVSRHRSIFRMKISRPGKYGFKGVVFVPSSRGQIEPYLFEKEFTAK